MNPNVNIDVFIHKVDGLSDDQKIETQREVQSQIESATDNLSAQVALNLTSIYDHSIFEAFSKCVQRLIPQLPMLENLLNVFISVGQTTILSFDLILVVIASSSLHRNHRCSTIFFFVEFLD